METGDNGIEKKSCLPVEESNACATIECELPVGTIQFDCQVAGHPFDPEKNKIGMLRDENGRVLKFCEKSILQEREIALYEAIENSDEPIYQELSQFTPKYFGTLETTYKNKPIKFLVLKDITEGISEPCIMDVKIGKRTWDPLAGPEKRTSDDRKYAASKKAYGFCIPGFQFYSLASDKLRKFNKDYGKKLDAVGVVNALKMFFNAESPDALPYRELVVHTLTHLWKIHAFFRKQTKFRFYASSLLFVYDARRLRSCIRTSTRLLRGINTREKTFSSCDTGLSIELTTNGSKNPEKIGKNITPVLAAANSRSASPVNAKTKRVRAIERLSRHKRSSSLTGCDFPVPSSSRVDKPTFERSGSHGRGLDEDFSPLCRTHSFTNNYDRDIAEMKEDYATLLEKLTGNTSKRQNWVRVNMIDFTHVFESEDNSPDVNYLEGLENLIKLLEALLA